MTKTQKILTAALWVLAIVALAGFIVANALRTRAAASQNDLPVLAQVPAFQLVDQDNKPVTDQTLRGKPWVGAFIFTTCGQACPMMSAKMSKLQSAIADKDVQLVSITVNPEFDSPAVLKAYAKRFEADESRWHFLTGDPDAVYGLARGLLLSIVPAAASQPILHSEKFVLVDAAGQMRAAFDSKDDAQLEQLKTAATKLAAEHRGRHG